MRKYGTENFYVEEIEFVETEELANERECYWINYYRSYVGFEDCNGYNATLGGDGKRFHDYHQIANKYKELKSVKKTAEFFKCDGHTVKIACEECGVKINRKPMARPIRRISNDGEVIEYESIAEALKSLNINRPAKDCTSGICMAANGHHKTAFGYRWEYIEK